MSLLVLDNYDSFTYNLVHLLRSLGVADLTVIRNDKAAVADLSRFERIVLSPGPGLPSEAGIMPEVVRRYAAEKSILGVCLGHQCIGEVFGARLSNLPEPVHGKGIATQVADSSDPLFAGVPKEFVSGRYHSWIVANEGFPKELKILAKDGEGEIMALRHRSHRIWGVQFHPESLLTPAGPQIVKNWLGV